MPDRTVHILGQPYWSERLAAVIRTHTTALDARFVPSRQYAALPVRLRRETQPIVLRAGFRVGSPSPRGRAFDAYWRVLRAAAPHATPWHYWLGTDVSLTLADHASGTIQRGPLARALGEGHVADAPWLAEELSAVGIHAAAISIPSGVGAPDEAPPLPTDFTVLTYLPGPRFGFYGGDITMAVARRMPDVRFLVVGQRPDPLPEDVPNVEWLGWASDMPSLYARASVVVRIPEHDGMGQTVVEGLLYGRHVVYTHALPHVTVIERTPTALETALIEFRARHLAGELHLNHEGRDWARAELGGAVLARRLEALLAGSGGAAVMPGSGADPGTASPTGGPAVIGPSGRPLRVHYLCLEGGMRRGEAPFAHVMAIVDGLGRRGWNVRLFRPPERAQRGVPRRLFDAALTQLRLMAAGRPDLYYLRGHTLALPTTLWARLWRVPVVLESNGATSDILSSWPGVKPIFPLLILLGHIQERLCSMVIGVTKELADAAAASGARRTGVVPNGADTEVFHPGAATFPGLPDPYVCFVGKLATWQGLDTVLGAVDAAEWPAGVHLVVAGDGPVADAVRARADRGDGRVVFLGRIPFDAVPSVVAHALASLAPMSASQRASTGVVPLKLFEGMASGVPVIVTDLPGQADIVAAEGCGLVIDPDDPVALARAVSSIASDPDARSRMGAAGRDAAVARYSWDAAAGRTQDLVLPLVVRR